MAANQEPTHQNQALPTPGEWREKIETVRRVREQAQKIRKGKPTSFRRAVGRAA